MISVSQHVVGGPVAERSTEHGWKPLPWILFRIKTHAQVWDEKGIMVVRPVFERMVLQGDRVCEALRDRLIEGVEVIVIGQGVNANMVCADGDVRGFVVLVNSIQIIQP